MVYEEKHNEETPKKIERRRGYSISVARIKITGILLAVIVVLVLILMSPVFNVRTIQVAGNVNTDASAYITASQISKGDNIFAVDVSDAIKKISSMDRVGSVTITRNLPSKIVIEVDEETESGYIKNKNEYAGIDPNGKVLIVSAKAQAQAPVIEGVKISEAKTGQYIKIDTDDAKARMGLISRILTEAKKQDIIKEIKAIDITNMGDIHMTLRSEILVNLGEDGKSAEDRIEYKIAYLKAIIPRLGTQHGGVIELSDTDNVTSRA